MTENNPLKIRSTFYVLISMLIFGTIGIFRRFIPLPSTVLAAFRGLSGSLFLIVLVLLKKKKLIHHMGMKKVLLLAVTGALMGLNWMMMFEAYNYTTVATATLCYYMEPTFVVLAAPLVLKEKLTLKKGICALVAVAGMVLVSGILGRGALEQSELNGILFALGAAMIYTAVVIVNKLVSGVDTYEKTIIQLFSAAIVLIPYILVNDQLSGITLSALQIVLLLITGFVHTGIAYGLYFSGLEHVKAQSAAILSYLDPIFALILAALILKEHMSVLSMLGAVMILGAAFVSEVNLKNK